MRRARAALAVPLLALPLLGVPVLAGTPALAATPASGTLAAPGAQDTTLSWTGSVPAGSDPTDTCPVATLADTFTLQVTAPADPSRTTTTVRVDWSPSTGQEMTNDLVLVLKDSAGKQLAFSDGATTTESVSVDGLTTGAYTVLTCGYANAAAQPYAGTATAHTTPAAQYAPPAPVFTPTTGGTAAGGPGPVVPEVPLAVLLPGLGVLMAGGVLGVRRRRAA